MSRPSGVGRSFNHFCPSSPSQSPISSNGMYRSFRRGRASWAFLGNKFDVSIFYVPFVICRLLVVPSSSPQLFIHVGNKIHLERQWARSKGISICIRIDWNMTWYSKIQNDQVIGAKVANIESFVRCIQAYLSRTISVCGIS